MPAIPGSGTAKTPTPGQKDNQEKPELAASGASSKSNESAKSGNDSKPPPAALNDASKPGDDSKKAPAKANGASKSGNVSKPLPAALNGASKLGDGSKKAPATLSDDLKKVSAKANDASKSSDDLKKALVTSSDDLKKVPAKANEASKPGDDSKKDPAKANEASKPGDDLKKVPAKANEASKPGDDLKKVPAKANEASKPGDVAKKPLVTSSDDLKKAPVKASEGSKPNDISLSDVLNKPSTLTADPEIDVTKHLNAFPVGTRIDERYEITGVLGAGGFATVYRAHHLMIDRDVALKVMDLQKGVDPTYSERFFREAKIAAKIRHNNVVSVYDFGFVAETKQPYIAMEMLHGHDLGHELTKRGPLSPNRAFILFRPVIEALGEGHRLGIVHKDLKPENLFLVDPGGARESMKVLDFGVARIDSGEVAKLTSAGQLLGTPRYLAPEYIRTQTVTPAIDVYQMALIMSEALSGVSAVSGDPFHAMMLHCSGTLRISNFLLEGPVGEVFHKAIAIEPEERYPNCEAFGEALDTIEQYFSNTVPVQGGEPQISPERRVSSKILGGGAFATGEFGVQPQDRSQSLGGFRPRRKARGLLYGAVAFLVILAIGLVVVFLNSTDSSDESPAPATARTFAFSFSSKPEGAVVRHRSGTVALCKTPCQYEFSEKDMPVRLLVSLSGYVESELELSERFYELEGGAVSVELSPVVVPSVELKFSLEYQPANAMVQDADRGVVCTRSPCAYIFDTSRTQATLIFSAQDHDDQQIILTEAMFAESPVVKISLERTARIPGRPRPVRPPGTTDVPDTPPQPPRPPRQPDPPPPPPPPPTIKLL